MNDNWMIRWHTCRPAGQHVRHLDEKYIHHIDIFCVTSHCYVEFHLYYMDRDSGSAMGGMATGTQGLLRDTQLLAQVGLTAPGTLMR